MRRVVLLCLLGAALAVLAGCGAKTSSKASSQTSSQTTAPLPPNTAPAPIPTLTSASDIAACQVLGRNLSIVSAMLQNNENVIIASTHPKQLAKAVKDARKVLIYVAQVMRLTEVPTSLEGTRTKFVSGIDSLTRDYKQAAVSVGKNDIGGAASYMQDGPAFQKITAATKRMQKTCKGT